MAACLMAVSFDEVTSAEQIVSPRNQFGFKFPEFPGLGEPGDGFPFFESLKETMIFYIGLWIILPFYSIYDLLALVIG